jgi:hypothetical protein
VDRFGFSCNWYGVLHVISLFHIALSVIKVQVVENEATEYWLWIECRVGTTGLGINSHYMGVPAFFSLKFHALRHKVLRVDVCLIAKISSKLSLFYSS